MPTYHPKRLGGADIPAEAAAETFVGVYLCFMLPRLLVRADGVEMAGIFAASAAGATCCINLCYLLAPEHGFYINGQGA